MTLFLICKIFFLSFIIKLNPSSDNIKKCIDFYKSFLPTYDSNESEIENVDGKMEIDTLYGTFNRY